MHVVRAKLGPWTIHVRPRKIDGAMSSSMRLRVVLGAQVATWRKDLHKRDPGRRSIGDIMGRSVVAGPVMKLGSYTLRDGASTVTMLRWCLTLKLLLVALLMSEEDIAAVVSGEGGISHSPAYLREKVFSHTEHR